LWQTSINKDVALQSALLVLEIVKDLGGIKIKNWRRVGKLVRDKIPEVIASKGELPLYTKISGDILLGAVIEKVKEELGEFISDPSAKEAAVILEILSLLFKISGIEQDNIQLNIIEKRENFGGFDLNLLLEMVIEVD